MEFFPLHSCLGVPGCFRHSWEPVSFSLGVSLDACVVAGNTFVFFCSFLSFLLSLPLPPSCTTCLHTNEALQQVFNEVWFHRFLSPSFGSPFSSCFPLTHLFPLFSFTSLCLHVLSSHPFFAHVGPDLSVYMHIYLHCKPRFQVAQV